MRALPLPFHLILVAALAGTAIACGDDATPTVDSGTDSALPDGGDSGVVDNGVGFDETFDGTCLGSLSCDDGLVESACACTVEPRPEGVFTSNRVGCGQLEASGEIARTPKDDFCDGAAGDAPPNFGCFMPGSYNVAVASETITLYGVVDVFGNGGDADNITVEAYAENADGSLGELLGSSVASVGDPCSEVEDLIENDMVIGTRNLGFYFIENIPSETPIVIKQSGNPDFWRTIYSYNIYAPDAELERDAPAADACATMSNAAFDGVPRWEFKARILSTSDWTSIPLTAGLVEGVRSGSGVVAGEVHDCDDVRIEYAQIGTTPEAIVTTYFNDNPDNPLPSAGRTEGTSLLGLFAALDIPEGPVDIAALARVDGEIVSAGWYRARVFAGAVTTVTVRGLRPFQTTGPTD